VTITHSDKQEAKSFKQEVLTLRSKLFYKSERDLQANVKYYPLTLAMRKQKTRQTKTDSTSEEDQHQAPSHAV